MNKPKFETPDMAEKNIEKLAEIFPNCITEARDENGKLKKAVNFEMLQQILSTEFPPEGSPERYEFTWVGKRAAIAEANKPIRKTLRPCKAESKNWDTTENLYIEGDNLEVLKLLQESYLGKVKMIYIDPPYNTGNDFIYRDDFKKTRQEYEEQAGLFDEDENRLFKNTETNGRFHSDWCSMMYSRLMLAKNFLSDDGVIFISIDDNEQDNLKKISDEIFGESNFINCITRISKTTSFRGNFFSPSKDYLLVYAKKLNFLTQFKDEIDNKIQFNKIEESGTRKGEYYRDDIAFYLSTLETRPNQRYFIKCPDGELVIPPGSTIPKIKEDGVKVLPIEGDGVWRWEVGQYLKKKELLSFKITKTSPLINQDGKKAKWNIYTKSYLNDKKENGNIPRDVFDKFLNRNGSEDVKKINIPFLFPKPVNLIKYILKIINNKDNIFIMDFFSGSATTAHAVMQLNAEDGGHRKFIMVQLPEVCDEKSEAYKAGYKNICEIGKERIRRAGEKIKADNPLTTQDLDIGFRVFKVDSSNMNDVYYSAGEYSQDMLVNLEDNIKPDRTDLDLLFGCLLDWGLPISLPYTSEQIENCTVHTYNDGDLVACFDENIPESVIKEIAKRKPLRAVFRDAGFGSSPEKINVTEIFKMLAPDTDVKVI